jgi:hypothetical protein
MHHHRARVVALTFVAALGACTRGGFAPPSPDHASDSALEVGHALDGPRPDSPGLDGSLLDTPRPDGAVPDQPLAESGAPVACSWTGSFSLSAPANLTSLNSPVEDGNPYLTPDGKTLYFESKRPGGTGVEDIWTSTLPGSSRTSCSATRVFSSRPLPSYSLTVPFRV